MADHVVCVSVRIKNHNNNLENLISKQIGQFNHKLTLEDKCNEVLGDSELDPSVNKALYLQQVKVELRSRDSSSDKFEIDFTEALKTAVEFQTNLKFIVFTIFAASSNASTNELQSPTLVDPFKVMMSSGLVNQKY